MDGHEPERTTSMREVAEHAGVAMSSVSRVLSGHPDVSPAMRRRVIAAVEELGYEPNLLAQSLRRGATMSVGFVVRDISSPLFSEIVLGAETVLRASGYSMLLTNSEGSPELDAQHIRLFRQRRVDGLLLSLADEAFEPTLDELRRLTVPLVLIDRDVAGAEPASAVLCDHAAGMRAAVERLVLLGHARIGLVGGPDNLRPGRECARAVVDACAERGARAIVEAGPFSPEHGYAATSHMLDAAEAPTALIAGSNQIFPGVLRALRERDLAIPEDVSLVTFDDVLLLDFLEPGIAVVSREPLRIGQEAARLLLRLLAGGGPEQVVVPTVFDPRASLAAPAARR
jgi:LacI family transcriptional regulator